MLCLLGWKMGDRFSISLSLSLLNVSASPTMCVLQAYTSQFIVLVMFALVMSEDRVSMQPRRRQIIEGLKNLPGTVDTELQPWM